MDSLTAAVALIIDNDKTELAMVLESTREAAKSWKDDPNTMFTREEWMRETMHHALRRHVAEISLGDYDIPARVQLFGDIAVNHMYTHTDWRALAQHYVDKVVEGVTVPE